jgi:hypothetical protein
MAAAGGRCGAFSCALPSQAANCAENFRQEQLMRLEPLYRIRFSYPESWAVGLDGGWQQMFFLAEGRCEGLVTGRFRGANFPRKEGADGPLPAGLPGRHRRR